MVVALTRAKKFIYREQEFRFQRIVCGDHERTGRRKPSEPVPFPPRRQQLATVSPPSPWFSEVNKKASALRDRVPFGPQLLLRREAPAALKAFGEQDGARTRWGCYGAPRFTKARGLFLMATRALQQSAAVRRVQGKSILRVGVSAASLRLSKSAVPETEKTAAAPCHLPSFDPIIPNGCLFYLSATTAAYRLCIGRHVTLLGQSETPVAHVRGKLDV